MKMGANHVHNDDGSAIDEAASELHIKSRFIPPCKRPRVLKYFNRPVTDPNRYDTCDDQWDEGPLLCATTPRWVMPF